MKRLLLALTITTALTVGAVPVAGAAPPVERCSRKELVGVRGGTEGIGASDIINGAARIVSTANGDGTATHRLSVSVDLADLACDGITYTITVTDPASGGLIFQEPVTAVGTSTVVLAQDRIVPQDSVDVVVTTSSELDTELDRAPNTGTNNVTAGIGGGQGWN